MSILDLVYVLATVALAVLGMFPNEFPFRAAVILMLGAVALWGGIDTARSNRELTDSVKRLENQSQASREAQEFLRGQLSSLSAISAKTLERITEVQPASPELADRALKLSSELLAWAGERKARELAISLAPFPPAASEEERNRAWHRMLADSRTFSLETMREYAVRFQPRVHALVGEFAARGIEPKDIVMAKELKGPTNSLAFEDVSTALADMAARAGQAR